MSTAVKSVKLPKESKPDADGAAEQARQVHRFPVRQYHRMIEEGILTADAQAELLEGYVVQTMPINPPHNAAIIRMNRRLLLLLPDGWLLQVQGAVALRDSEPEPDFAILRGPEETYFRRKPIVRDVALLIEAAGITLLDDRRYKAHLYAQARIPEYWIIDLVHGLVEVYTQPRGGKNPGYRQKRIYGKEEAVPLTLDGRESAQIPVRELLPQ